MMLTSLKRCLFSFTLAVMILGAAGSNQTAKAEELSVESVPGTETVDVKKAKELFDAGALFVDSRSKAAFDAGRISGAESIPLSKTATDADFAVVKASLEKMTTPEKPVVMYCNGVKCPLSAAMAAKAVEWGYKKVYYFRLGYPAWKEAGYAVE